MTRHFIVSVFSSVCDDVQQDVLIILDSTIGTAPSIFDLQKSFIKILLNEINETKVKLTVQVYSDEPTCRGFTQDRTKTIKEETDHNEIRTKLSFLKLKSSTVKYNYKCILSLINGTSHSFALIFVRSKFITNITDNLLTDLSKFDNGKDQLLGVVFAKGAKHVFPLQKTGHFKSSATFINNLFCNNSVLISTDDFVPLAVETKISSELMLKSSSEHLPISKYIFSTPRIAHPLFSSTPSMSYVLSDPLEAVAATSSDERFSTILFKPSKSTGRSDNNTNGTPYYSFPRSSVFHKLMFTTSSHQSDENSLPALPRPNLSTEVTSRSRNVTETKDTITWKSSMILSLSPQSNIHQRSSSLPASSTVAVDKSETSSFVSKVIESITSLNISNLLSIKDIGKSQKSPVLNSTSGHSFSSTNLTTSIEGSTLTINSSKFSSLLSIESTANSFSQIITSIDVSVKYFQTQTSSYRHLSSRTFSSNDEVFATYSSGVVSPSMSTNRTGFLYPSFSKVDVSPSSLQIVMSIFEMQPLNETFGDLITVSRINSSLSNKRMTIHSTVGVSLSSTISENETSLQTVNITSSESISYFLWSSESWSTMLPSLHSSSTPPLHSIITFSPSTYASYSAFNTKDKHGSIAPATSLPIYPLLSSSSSYNSSSNSDRKKSVLLDASFTSVLSSVEIVSSPLEPTFSTANFFTNISNIFTKLYHTDNSSSIEQLQTSISMQSNSIGKINASSFYLIQPISVQQSSISIQQSSLSIEQSSIYSQQSTLSIQQYSTYTQQSPMSLTQSSIYNKQSSVSIQEIPLPIQQTSISIQQSRIPITQLSTNIQQSPKVIVQSSIYSQQSLLSIQKTPLYVQPTSISIQQQQSQSSVIVTSNLSLDISQISSKTMESFAIHIKASTARK